MSRHWYKNAIFYAVDVRTFQDSDGDGVGDFRGLISRLDYLAELGITCLWLLPFYYSGDRDNGYDVVDYYQIQSRLGTLEDVETLIQDAGERGIRVLVDLVMNHTSDRHPWFQAARRDPGSRYRDYYVWSPQPPPVPRGKGTILPGEESTVWTYDPVARAYYHHRFHAFEPELNVASQGVREEMLKVMDFWLALGVSGFRLDAVAHLIEEKAEERPTPPLGQGYEQVLLDLRRFLDRRRPDAILLGEADVAPDEVPLYVGAGDRLHLLLNFLLDNYLVLALATQRAEPLARVLRRLPGLPEASQWVNFLRNLDELDLEQLSDAEREQVYEVFAPDPAMRIYGRGIRRRLAPMLDGDRRRLELAFSLLFSLPGSPLIVYGDELGMGEDLARPGREAVRTPMQWSDACNAGFSEAAPEALIRPVVADGPFAYPQVSVQRQRHDPASLLAWMRHLIHLRRDCPEWGWGRLELVETGDAQVFGHLAEWHGGHLLALHNLSDRAVTIKMKLGHDGSWRGLLSSATLDHHDGEPLSVHLEPNGYRWFRRERGL